MLLKLRTQNQAGSSAVEYLDNCSTFVEAKGIQILLGKVRLLKGQFSAYCIVSNSKGIFMK